MQPTHRRETPTTTRMNKKRKKRTKTTTTIKNRRSCANRTKTNAQRIVDRRADRIGDGRCVELAVEQRSAFSFAALLGFLRGSLARSRQSFERQSSQASRQLSISLRRLTLARALHSFALPRQRLPGHGSVIPALVLGGHAAGPHVQHLCRRAGRESGTGRLG
jgi:hypothetical protein